jgi:TonB family protein
MNPKLFLPGIILILSIALHPANGQTLPQSQELIQAANAATDLKVLRPYTLQATIVVKPGTKDEKRGRLTIFQGKDQSRTELEFGTYRELRIVIGSREYVARNAQARPVELQRIEDTRQLWRVGIASSDEIGHSTVKKTEGVQANCVEVRLPRIEDDPEWTPPRESVLYCFDPDKKVLLLASTDRESGKPLSEIHYVNYQSAGGVQIPGAIRHFSLGKPSGVDFEDIQVSSLNPDSVQFSPPSNALELETCEDMQPSRMIQKVEPHYPQMAKIARVQGDVYLSAIIGKDGSLQNIKLISGHPILAQAALDAIRQWRYLSSMCGSSPVAVETEITVRFHMGH